MITPSTSSTKMDLLAPVPFSLATPYSLMTLAPLSLSRGNWTPPSFSANFRCDSRLSALMARISALASWNRWYASLKEDSSLIQPELLSFG